MLNFQRLDLTEKEKYTAFLTTCGERGCEYSFANLNLWGRQRVTFLDGFLVLFSQFERRSVYPFPIGKGDIKPVLDAIVADAKERGIVCRLSGLTAQDCMTLDELFPGQFHIHPDRNSCDYVYAIEDLALLKGRKYQKKRNHLNKFRENHPHCQAVPITKELLPQVQDMVAQWYAQRLDAGSDDFHLEQLALKRAFQNMDALGLEGLALLENGEVFAMTMGSRLSNTTFDVHFEKAVDAVDGAYPAINQAFAAYLWEKYPELQFLNREEDMGLAGLRKAKLSYYPHHLVTKFWARLWEEDDEN